MSDTAQSMMLAPVLSLVLFAQPGVADTVQPVRFELPNGLRVWVREDHARPVALVQVTYKIGSLHESAGLTGIAHYVEHMVYRATQNVRNEDVYGYIDRIGGRYTGGTWPEMTQYAETVPSWALESALRVTAERMCCALFDSLEFERERSNVVTEANGFADTDAINAFRDALMTASFELHPYRYGSNTWARDNLTLTRAEAYDWYKRFYGPNNAVLVVVGDVAAADVRRLVEKHFGEIPRAPQSGAITLREPPQAVEKRVTVRYPGTKRQLVLFYRAPAATDSAHAALTVVTRHLSARLPQLLTDAGLRNVEVAVADSASQYPFVLRVSAEGDTTARLEEILHVIDAEIVRVARVGLTESELLAARRGSSPTQAGARPESQSGGIPPRRSSLTQLADALTNREVFSWEVGPDVLERMRARAASTRSKDVRDFVARWLQPNHRTVGFLTTDANASFAEATLSVPPLTTPPATRLRPEAVPAKALEPLAAIQMSASRRLLPNGAVIRAARSQPNAGAPHLRIAFTEPADSAWLTQVLAADAVLRRTNARVSWSYQGAPRTRDSAHARVLRALSGGPHASRSGGVVAIAVAAPGEPGEVVDAVTEIARRLPARVRRHAGPRAHPATAREERVANASDRQVSVYAGLPGVPRNHTDRRALELLNYIVGVPSYGGRLGWALTKAGLTYSSAATTTFGDESGTIVFGTRCDTRNTDATIQAIREVIEGVGARGVEEWELREAQAFMLGRMTLYGARESSDTRAIATALVDSEFSGLDGFDLPSYSRAYLSVTHADINRVAKRYYRPELLQIAATGAVPAVREQIFPPGTFRALFEP
jgi:zinc protease